MRLLRTAPSAALTAFLALGVAGCGYSGSSASDDASASAAASQAVYGDWAPDGFKAIDNVALKWDDGGWSNDGILHSEGATVVARDGCSMLYFEANLLDSSGTIVGYTNAVVNNIEVGQQAHVTFDWTEDGVERILPTEVNCT